VQDKLNALIEKQCASIPKTVEAIGVQLQSVMESGANSTDALEHANALVHQLKGISGTAGFTEICEAATALYDCLELPAHECRPPTGVELEQAMALYRKLADLGRNVRPAASWLYTSISNEGVG
jgi:HPt (histidine-containing phosphotransfer) domain-containing protein